jgi:hypothetical protein
MIRIAAAWRYSGSDRAEARIEEFSAIIKGAPGKLTKLFVAGTFLSAAGATAIYRRWSALHRVVSATTKNNAGQVLHQIYLERRRRFLNGLNQKDRARFLLQERISDKARMAATLSELQNLRGQTLSRPVPPEDFPDPRISARTVIGGIGCRYWRFGPWYCRLLCPFVIVLSFFLDGRRRTNGSEFNAISPRGKHLFLTIMPLPVRWSRPGVGHGWRR